MPRLLRKQQEPPALQEFKTPHHGRAATCGVCINGGSCFRTGTQPFGGYKQSGIGVEGMSRTLELMTQEKTFARKGVFL